MHICISEHACRVYRIDLPVRVLRNSHLCYIELELCLSEAYTGRNSQTEQAAILTCQCRV